MSAPLTPERVASIIDLVKQAREAGVSELSADGVSFKLYPTAPAPRPKGERLPDLAAIPNCACGHGMHIHRDGICKDCGPSANCVRMTPPGVR